MLSISEQQELLRSAVGDRPWDTVNRTVTLSIRNSFRDGADEGMLFGFRSVAGAFKYAGRTFCVLGYPGNYAAFETDRDSESALEWRSCKNFRRVFGFTLARWTDEYPKMLRRDAGMWIVSESQDMGLPRAFRAEWIMELTQKEPKRTMSISGFQYAGALSGRLSWSQGEMTVDVY